MNKTHAFRNFAVVTLITALAIIGCIPSIVVRDRDSVVEVQDGAGATRVKILGQSPNESRASGAAKDPSTVATQASIDGAQETRNAASALEQLRSELSAIRDDISKATEERGVAVAARDKANADAEMARGIEETHNQALVDARKTKEVAEKDAAAVVSASEEAVKMLADVENQLRDRHDQLDVTERNLASRRAEITDATQARIVAMANRDKAESEEKDARLAVEIANKQLSEARDNAAATISTLDKQLSERREQLSAADRELASRRTALISVDAETQAVVPQKGGDQTQMLATSIDQEHSTRPRSYQASRRPTGADVLAKARETGAVERRPWAAWAWGMIGIVVAVGLGLVASVSLLRRHDAPWGLTVAVQNSDGSVSRRDFVLEQDEAVGLDDIDGNTQGQPSALVGGSRIVHEGRGLILDPRGQETRLNNNTAAKKVRLKPGDDIRLADGRQLIIEAAGPHIEVNAVEAGNDAITQISTVGGVS